MCSKTMLVSGTFKAVLAIVAPADDYLPKWLSLWTKVCAPTVIFVADHHLLPRLLKVALQRHVRHKARTTAFGIEVKYAYALEFRSLKRFIVVSKKLEACAHAQKNRVRLRCFK